MMHDLLWYSRLQNEVPQRCSGSYLAAAVSSVLISDCSVSQEMFSKPFYCVCRRFLSYCREINPKFRLSLYQGTDLEEKIHDYFPFLFTQLSHEHH